MDAKYPANLDPKLREAYDRVMGGIGTGAQPQAHTQAQTQSDDHKEKEHHETDKPEAKVAIHTDKPTVVHIDGDSDKKEKPQTSNQQSSSMTAILLGIIGVLFFIGYGIFWAQFFGFDIVPSF